MNKHATAKHFHYDTQANHYDAFSEETSATLSNIVFKLLKSHKPETKTILDLTSGTGSQSCYLAKRGYSVTASDFNTTMLEIAKRKAAEMNLNLKFIKADMRNICLGKFDVAISMYNAIGHLTRKDFELTMKNLRNNLKDKGLYIFDILNKDYLLQHDNITHLTTDQVKLVEKAHLRKTQYSILQKDGVLTSYTFFHTKGDKLYPEISTNTQTLQIYNSDEIKKMLERSGFGIVEFKGMDTNYFDKNKDSRMIVVAYK